MRTMRIAPTIGLLLMGAGCTDEPTLREQLRGTWDLVSVNSYQIPGWVTSCYMVGGCDSTYTSSGQLVLRPDDTCTRTWVYGADSVVTSCVYLVNGNAALIQYERNGEFDLAVEGDNLWVSSDPCGIEDWGCSQYIEHYRRRES